MRFAIQIAKIRIQTHSEYVILIDFPQHKWLRECALMLRYAYIACLVFLKHCKALVTVMMFIHV
jgi:hypothetical protein